MIFAVSFGFTPVCRYWGFLFGSFGIVPIFNMFLSHNHLCSIPGMSILGFLIIRIYYPEQLHLR